MKLDEIRIYAEVLEQGLNFKKYLKTICYDIIIKNIYTKKLRSEFDVNDSIIDRIRKVKDVDVLITAISQNKEYPLLLVEYSTAVPTDDHKMQRSDVYYWSAFFKTPMMKISPSIKGMKQKFGGGSKINDDLEIAIACRRNAVLYQIPWETDKNHVLNVDKNILSCITYSKQIENILKKMLNIFLNTDSIYEYYEKLRIDYINNCDDILKFYTYEKMIEIFSKSKRFDWIDNKLKIKINRFGHAMDPERGILYFVNMIMDPQNVITKIQINRDSDYYCRGGYNKLFDGLSNKEELETYVKELIDCGNKFDDNNALYILNKALNLNNELEFEKSSDHNYFINNKVMYKFLNSHPSMATKSIFFLSTELHLTDQKRDIICKIKWDKSPINCFINSIATDNFKITDITPVSMQNVKEDIITYASVELYKQLKFGLLAVSYPGAQGDRCILKGSGRTVERIYVDVIAYNNCQGKINVYLEECKEKFENSKNDVKKLKMIKSNADEKSGLKKLFSKIIGVEDISEIYTSIAAKVTKKIPNYDVDYIFMFDIQNDNNFITRIDYTVAIVNVNLVEKFSQLKNNEGKLKGTLEMNQIYVIS